MKYYHNPRCTKSREGLAYLNEKGIEPELILYMKEPLGPTELEELIEALGIDAIDLVRTKEKIWKEEFAGKELEEDELILAMIEYPNLMERPIFLKDGQAAIGRPKENFDSII